MDPDEKNSRRPIEEIGLCARCRFLRTQTTRRGALFFRCARADEDGSFVRYPPLPVLECVGHEPDPSDGFRGIE